MSKFFEDEDFYQTQKEEKEARKRASKQDRSQHKKTDKEKRERLLKEKAEQKLAKQENLIKGRVLSISAEGISVQYENNVYLCVLRGALKKEKTRAKNLITVGDFVLFEKEKFAIAHVEPRTSTLSRKEHLRRHQNQLIAANIDQVLITVSVIQPSLKPPLVDRYIIASYKGNMQPVIVINKIDLLKKNSPEMHFFKDFVQTYEALDIPVIAVSAEKNKEIAKLKKQMKDKASVFSGQSGVGKSSLINAVTGLQLAAREVNRKTLKGAHTTSSTHLIPLSCGGWCIDTPGIRSFGVWDLQKPDLDAYFPEIFEKSQNCKFRGCTHSHEPGCAVKDSVSSLRLQSYHKLLEEIVEPNKHR